MLVLNKYRMLEEIGKGGMGLVYRAQDEKVGRIVAIKELIIPIGTINKDKEMLIERFKREATTASSLSHPNIVTVFDFGEFDNRYFLAMEFLKGENLKEFFIKNHISIEEIIQIFIQAAEGINFAHSKDVIHRDIKPDNIHILPGNLVKITDFGIAKMKNIESNLTQDGHIFGTLGYISPEQVTNAKTVDHRADIYSFGAMMYEIITGSLLFEADNLAAIIYKILMVGPRSIKEINADIPEDIEKIILKCIEKDPKDRYQGTDELIKDLRKSINDNKSKKIVINSKKVNENNSKTISFNTIKTNPIESDRTVKISKEDSNSDNFLNMTRGQKVIIKEYIDSEAFTIGINWKYKNEPINIDLSAIMLSESGKLEKDENFVFYNNLVSGCRSIRLDQSDNTIYQTIIDLDLKKVPEDISRIKIIINTEKSSLKELENIELSIIGNKSLIYSIDDFDIQKTGIIADIYQHKGEWKIQATGEGYNLDLEGLLKKYISESVEIYND